MEKQDQPIRPTLIDLAVGASVSFPLIRLRSVRSQASELGAIYDRKYTTQMNRIERTITVTRLS